MTIPVFREIIITAYLCRAHELWMLEFVMLLSKIFVGRHGLGSQELFNGVAFLLLNILVLEN